MEYSVVYKKVYQFNEFKNVVDYFEILEYIGAQIIFCNNEKFLLMKNREKEILETIDGYTRITKKGYEIIINKDIIFTRKMFTIFHELGHIILQHFTKRRFLSENQKEKEANVFARNMLIPHLKYIDNLNSKDRIFNEYLKENVSKKALEVKEKIFLIDSYYVDKVLKELDDE